MWGQQQKGPEGALEQKAPKEQKAAIEQKGPNEQKVTIARVILDYVQYYTHGVGRFSNARSALYPRDEASSKISQE